jgi:hypothetical protein
VQSLALGGREQVGHSPTDSRVKAGRMAMDHQTHETVDLSSAARRRGTLIWRLVGAGAALLVLAGAGHASAKVDNLFGALGPVVRWYHLYSADDGKSHITEMPVPVSTGSYGAMTIFDRPVSRVSIASYPDGTHSDWHYAIHTHVIIYLQGTQVIDLDDGKEYRLEPGVAVLAEDWTGRGHRYRCEAKTGAHACVAIDIIVGEIDKHMPLDPAPPAAPR